MARCHLVIINACLVTVKFVPRFQHVFLGATKQGKVAIFKTSGNDDTHIILRGGKEPNYEKKLKSGVYSWRKKLDWLIED